MTTLFSRTEEDYLKERALFYKNKGYSVRLEPDASFLPDFLKDFSIDLIAKNGNENVIVEVKSRQELKENLSNMDKLDEAIKAHPGWHLELVLLKDEPTPLLETNPETRINEVVKLQDSDYSDAALLLLWGAIEIGLRRIAKRENIDVDQKSFDYLIKSLVSLGLLEDDVYKVLLETSKVRNAVAHGYGPSENTKGVVEELLPIARSLV